MRRLQMGEQELHSRLLELDRAAALLYPGRRFRLVLVGGGALVLLGCLTRATADLDALNVPYELVNLIERYDVSARVAAYSDQFAHTMEDRLIPLTLETECLEYRVASLEDIVGSKLYSNRPIDESDVRRPEVLAALDWDRLDEVVEDMRGTVLVDRRYRDMLANYEAYKKECRPCGT